MSLRSQFWSLLKAVSLFFILVSFCSLLVWLIVNPPSDYYHDSGWGIRGEVNYQTYCTNSMGDIGVAFSNARCNGKLEHIEGGIQILLLPLDFVLYGAYGVYFYWWIILPMYLLGIVQLAHIIHRKIYKFNLSWKLHTTRYLAVIVLTAISLCLLALLVNQVSNQLMLLDVNSHRPYTDIPLPPTPIAQ